QGLNFSCGVVPVHLETEPEDWPRFTRDWLKAQGMAGPMAILVAGPSPRHPHANPRIEFIRL
ncbi:MAG TPA: pyruvate kinase, partial [Candidatus Paceibacterota bacterium]|nr:pyruvate kinase [Candidatus Paceibacterota bacterium]